MTTPLRVLFVEDSEDDMRLLVRQLRQGGYGPAVERVETGDGLRSALHRGGWDIIISDYTMPRLSGLEALAVTLQLAPDVPFLLVSGTVGEEVAVESIKSGAADYLMKQNLIRFVPAVCRALRDAAERRAMRRARICVARAAVAARNDLRQHFRCPRIEHLGPTRSDVEDYQREPGDFALGSSPWDERRRSRSRRQAAGGRGPRVFRMGSFRIRGHPRRLRGPPNRADRGPAKLAFQLGTMDCSSTCS